jgi:enoyl-CoA hydratase/carnithine racemase
MLDELRLAVSAILSEDAVTGLMIRGRGPSFCAGIDLNEFAEGTPESARVLIGSLKQLCATVYASPKPVACAIQGHCVGGALELALAADLRVCTDDAMFAMPEVTIGLPSVIHAALLPRYIGLGRARQMLLTGDAITARTAHEWGLVDQVVAEERDLTDACRSLLNRVTRNDPGAVRAQKQLLREWLEGGIQEVVESSQEALVEAFKTGLPQDLARRRLGRE